MDAQNFKITRREYHTYIGLVLKNANDWDGSRRGRKRGVNEMEGNVVEQNEGGSDLTDNAEMSTSDHLLFYTQL